LDIVGWLILSNHLIINLIRTLALLDEEQREIIIRAIEEDQHFQFITTPEVKTEVKQRLLKKKSNNDTDEFFANRKDAIKQIERRLFKKIRTLTIEKNCNLTLLVSSTSLKNLGEKSLVVLLLCRYHTQISGRQDSIHIVSNNHRDVQPIYRKAVQLFQQNTNLPREISNIQHIHEFYIELLLHLKIEREIIVFFLSVSNIDIRAIDLKIVEAIRALF